ncbi:hypothetical protein DEU56DRAFT_906178 [Suillus clintonianus]|uniref:uncharacterized protein n=1 Tax=Suillus clintonianus TaxID=1904413 RepID=UPI001B870CDA|nr:uncharacterized protein DEU56DRAFT_906178 [Suillus clintonianus]KAG2157544.1 hypothetical protein DEU56DRAFT_906178 [Suillus clintonianus]
MSYIPILLSFRGDYCYAEEPYDWLQQFKAVLPKDWKDESKIDRFHLQCKAGSIVDFWIETLPAMQKTTWKAFEAAFVERWLLSMSQTHTPAPPVAPALMIIATLMNGSVVLPPSIQPLSPSIQPLSPAPAAEPTSPLTLSIHCQATPASANGVEQQTHDTFVEEHEKSGEDEKQKEGGEMKERDAKASAHLHGQHPPPPAWNANTTSSTSEQVPTTKSSSPWSSLRQRRQHYSKPPYSTRQSIYDRTTHSSHSRTWQHPRLRRAHHPFQSSTIPFNPCPQPLVHFTTYQFHSLPFQSAFTTDHCLKPPSRRPVLLRPRSVAF